MENNYRPTRLDHFPKTDDLKHWLEDHKLDVDSKHPEVNINTMMKATGGRVIR